MLQSQECAEHPPQDPWTEWTWVLRFRVSKLALCDRECAGSVRTQCANRSNGKTAGQEPGSLTVVIVELPLSCLQIARGTLYCSTHCSTQLKV